MPRLRSWRVMRLKMCELTLSSPLSIVLNKCRYLAVVIMDWECKSLDWTDHDFRKFRYGLGESTVLTKFPPNKVASKSGGLLELTGRY